MRSRSDNALSAPRLARSATRPAARRALASVIGAAAAGGLALASAVAVAEEPVIAAEDAPSAVTQSTTTTVTTTTSNPAPAPAQVAPAPIAQPAPAAIVVQPPPMAIPYVPPPVAAPMMMPPPPVVPQGMGAFQGPIYYNGPVWIVPATPGMPAPVAAPAPIQQLPPPPVYVQPPRPVVQFRPIVPAYRPLQVSKLRPERGPVVAVGLRFSVLGIGSQEVFGQKVNMLGGGIQVRFRSQGHFGFELALDALRADLNDGGYVRTSYPFTFAPMLYLFKNKPANHFNIYATAGFGLMADDVTLYKGTSQQRNQQFWEVLGQAGGGIEMRFHRLALFADIRAIGMLLDDSSPAGQFYQGVDGGPIAASSVGYKTNIGAHLWF